MKMEVIAVQQQYQTQYGVLGSNKVKDWTSTLTPPTVAATEAAAVAAAKQQQNNKNNNNKIKSSINKKSNRTVETNNKINSTTSNSRSSSFSSFYNSGRVKSSAAAAAASMLTPKAPSTNTTAYNNESSYYTTVSPSANANLFYCDDIDAAAVDELSMRLLDELRAAKSRHLTCTEVCLPCDLTTRIAAELIRVSEKEPRGIRGCTIYIEFEDEPNNSRRIATLKLDPEMVSTFEVYLTLRQDHRGWTSLLPQFMKSLARTIYISPEFTITKHKLYSPHESSFTSYYANGTSSSSSNSSSAAISTPSS